MPLAFPKSVSIMCSPPQCWAFPASEMNTWVLHVYIQLKPITVFKTLLIFSSFHKLHRAEPHIHPFPSPSLCFLAKLGACLHCFNELRSKHLHYLLIQGPLPWDTISFHSSCGQSQPALLLELHRLIALTILLWAFFHCWDLLVLPTFTS